MLSSNSLESLEERLAKIEYYLFGNGSNQESHPKIVAALSELGTKVEDATTSREKMSAVMKRLDELDKYLDPCYNNSPSHLTEAELCDVLFSQSQYWHQQHEALTHYASLNPVLESKPIADTANLTEKLAAISLQHSELDQLSQQQSEEVTEFTQSYNDILKVVSSTLVNLESMITKLEMAAAPKKNKS